MGEMMAGGCLCGRVRYEVIVESKDAYWCHCRMCQKATGGIAAAFVRNAVRAQDERGAIAVEDRDGLPVLALSSEWDGERYVQYIYGYQGQLCELFTAAEYDFVPEDGEPVCAAQAFEPTLEGDLLTVRVTDETGHVSTVYIARRCAQ